MKIVLFPGLISAQEISTIVSMCQVVGIIVKSKRRKEFNIIDSSLVSTKESFLDSSNTNSNFKINYENEYIDCYRYVINDCRTGFIAERQLRHYGLNSSFNLAYKIESIVYNALVYLKDKKPERLVFQATPHGVFTWIIAKVAEYLDIEVTFNAMTMLPSKYQPVTGLDTQIPIITNNKNPRKCDKKSIDDYIDIKLSDYDKAIPEYEKRREDKFKGKFFSWKNELSFIKNIGYKHIPFMAIESIKKKIAYKKYQSLVSCYPNRNGNIVFFLHFQPERTSLPEGGIFCNQLVIVRKLNEIARNFNINILVKEHPSMFRQPWDSSVRSVDFYNRIAEMSNVYLMPLEMNSYELMQKSILNVTITGTVILESILKRKPVLVFGLKQLPKIEGIIRYKNDNCWDEIREFINGEASISETIVEDVRKILYEVDKNSYLVNEKCNTSVEAFKMLCSGSKNDIDAR